MVGTDGMCDLRVGFGLSSSCRALVSLHCLSGSGRDEHPRRVELAVRPSTTPVIADYIVRRNSGRWNFNHGRGSLPTAPAENPSQQQRESTNRNDIEGGHIAFFDGSGRSVPMGEMVDVGLINSNGTNKVWSIMP